MYQYSHTSDSKAHDLSIVTGNVKLSRVLSCPFVGGKQYRQPHKSFISRQMETSWGDCERPQNKLRLYAQIKLYLRVYRTFIHCLLVVRSVV